MLQSAGWENTWLSIQEFDTDSEEDPVVEEERIRSDPDRIDELEMLEDDKLLFGAADKVSQSWLQLRWWNTKGILPVKMLFQDSDGKLSKTEFLSFSHPEEDQGMYDAVVKSLLRNKDKNGDGVIDFQVGTTRDNVISYRLQMSSLKKKP